MTQQSQLLLVLFALSPLVFTFFAGVDPGIFYAGGPHFDSERTAELFLWQITSPPHPPPTLSSDHRRVPKTIIITFFINIPGISV